jgi:large subunit ribosomal protein L25
MVGTNRPTVSATARTLGTKSKLKQLRAAGIIPGSLYGAGDAPVSIQVNAGSIGNYLNAHGSGALMDLNLDGQTTPVVLREVDRSPVKGDCIHVSFQRVPLTGEYFASIPLYFEGLEELVVEGYTLQTLLQSIELHGRADQLPERLTVDVKSYVAGDVIHASSIPLPEGVLLTRDGATAIAIVSGKRADLTPVIAE